MVVIYLLISIVLIILMTARYKIHPFIVLFLVALFYGFCTHYSYRDGISCNNELYPI